MKNIACTIAMAMCGFTAVAADEPTTTAATTEPAMPTAQCSPCPKGMQCDGTAWVDVETLTIEAANGDPIAQYAIAYITDNGTGDTTKDPEKAKQLYKDALPGLQKAAEKGHPVACRALSRMYAEGKGVDKDDAKAAEYMKQCKKACKDHNWKNKDCCKGGDKKSMPCPGTPAPAQQPAA